MKDLRLSLIEIWFGKTKSLIKKEDYRSITPYWCNRLLLWGGKKLSKIGWYEKLVSGEHTTEYLIQKYLKNGLITFQDFTTNTMTLGYPSNNDKDRIIQFEHEGIEIRTGNPDWGAEEGKLYFVIKHGKKP